MNIFLTGGMGFIGSYVTKRLSDSGHTITVLARNPEKVPALEKLPGISLVPGLISDFDVIEEHLKDQDAFIHIALGWGELATSMLKNDTFPSIFLFETAARLGISRFIYTSSTAAVGNTPPGAGAEPPPRDYYGATKASSERFLYAISHQYSMHCSIIRPGYTFGNPVINGASMERDTRFIDIVRKAKANEPVKVTRNDGTQFIWAGDLAKVYEAMLDSARNRKCYFALGKDFVTWEKIAATAIRLTGSKSPIILLDKGYSPVPHLFDVTSIKEDFGFEFDNWERIVEHLEYLADYSTS
ncbi:MAG: NAD(P)-dependent oxidoreductase [Spirochaetales bacterium]|nr:NAD(P)-dependent oxidoreductase [Spirochaetales bacterium]